MYTLAEKTEVRDFMTELNGVDKDTLSPTSLSDSDVYMIRRLTIFQLWNVRQKIKQVLKDIYNSIKK